MNRLQNPPAADAPAQPGAAHCIEGIISSLLRIGVVISLTVVVAGDVLSFVRHRDYIGSPTELRQLTKPGVSFPHSLKQVGDGLRHGRGQAIVVLGLLLLIATPVMRVAVSILAFMHERDRAFTIITSIVLLLLLLSFVLGKAQ